MKSSRGCPPDIAARALAEIPLFLVKRMTQTVTRSGQILRKVHHPQLFIVSIPQQLLI
jgi:hypothetical protein